MSRTRKLRVASVVLLGAMALAGCNATIDPYQREGIWKPAGVNDANLAVQIANPADLAHGREDARGSVRTPTAAVDRLWAGVPTQRAQGGQGGAPAGGAGTRPEAPR